MKKLNEKGSIHYIPLVLIAIFLSVAVLNTSIKSQGSFKNTAVLADSEENGSNDTAQVEAKDNETPEPKENDSTDNSNDNSNEDANKETEKNQAGDQEDSNQESSQEDANEPEETLGEEQKTRIREENQYQEMNFVGSTNTESTYQTKRRVKLLGLINAILNEQVTVSNDTGDVVQIKRSLLAKILDFLSF